tara:strand:- start:1287 stop:2195 length:909 start_codon:yes stop_codon:yes gene_type:complete
MITGHESAINHAVLLTLANFNAHRIAALEGIDELIHTKDIKYFNYQAGRDFNTDTSVIQTYRSKIETQFNAFKHNLHAISRKDEKYPDSLKSLPGSPLVLYCRGNLNLFKGKTIAIVGSRAATDKGLRRSKKLSRLLSRAGHTIVSGLARGIDTMAHLGALEEGGQTIAVIGTPPDRSHPRENRQLQEQIATDHLLVSQFFIGQPMARANFAIRNYITSGISKATVVVEAGGGGGTLIQAKQCMKQGRHLFLLKSLVDRTDLTWPKKFVKKGAFVLSSLEDVAKAMSQAPDYGRPEKEQTLF